MTKDQTREQGCGHIYCTNECGVGYTWATCPRAQAKADMREIAERHTPALVEASRPFSQPSAETAKVVEDAAARVHAAMSPASVAAGITYGKTDEAHKAYCRRIAAAALTARGADAAAEIARLRAENKTLVHLADEAARSQEQMLAERDALRDEINRLRRVVQDCENQFRWYAEQHRAKVPPDIAKANVNEAMADACRAALLNQGDRK